ncbi:MAG: ribonuclease R [Gammaproteobacteria bacterium RBG_16_51_14]|nr:MAG: ribonuclease R [Gammaproteobacteria bacterium RBG_16_51_14]
MNKKKNTRENSKNSPLVPERQQIMDFLQSCGKPRTRQHITDALGVIDKDARRALGRRLMAMTQEGQLVRNRRGGYGLIVKMDLFRGRVIGHPDGYGFLVPDEGGGDLFLSAREMRSLLHGDRALVRLVGIDRRGRREGALVEVLDRANHRVVGRLYQEGNISFVVPDNRRIHQDILITPECLNGAVRGQFVITELITQPEKHMRPVGRITEIIGDHMQAGMAVDIAIRAHELPYDWPEEVLSECKQFRTDSNGQDFHSREDLRALPLVTIDGEDARDFDDAVYCEKQDQGWRLLVAIADVSHYVLPGSALDAEAALRGTSIYFPQRVIPMLPEILSNELCSLKPDVERLCLVCELHINRKGKAKHFRFFEGVIRSAARLTYTEVASILIEKNATTRKKYRTLIPCLEDLHTLFTVLQARRRRHGLIDFSSVETRLEFDEKGRIADIRPLQRNDAHRMIEEFMLAANVAAGEYLQESKLPILYRIHDTPKQEKLDDVRAFLGELGLVLSGSEEPTAMDYAHLVETVQKRDDAHLIETILLRSMPLAVYSPDNAGHFGLGFPVYTHFTSPIRRYPDLLVHRAIRYLIRAKPGKSYPYDKEAMHLLGEHCSMTERRAEDASRDAIQRLKCEFMQDRVGETFNGTISSVTSFGIFVELDGVYVEGLVHITALPADYYHFDPVGHRLRGERTAKLFRLANRVRVVVTRVDLDDRKIDFELAEKA